MPHPGPAPGSPRRNPAPGSPRLKSKFGSEPQSPVHGANRPFSYGAPVLPVMPPKLTQVEPNSVPNHSQNGHNARLSQSPVLGHQFDDQSKAGSPATHYGKHESVFQPQPHRPPPHVPPPPPPGKDGQGHPSMQQPQYPGNPQFARKMGDNQRRPSAPQSPKLTPKLSQRSQSVPRDPDYMPAPPPPLSVKDSYLAAAQHMNRPPSPPLPPPPPEMLEDLPPPPPPANVMPSHHQPAPQAPNMNKQGFMGSPQHHQVFQHQQQQQFNHHQFHQQHSLEEHQPYLEPQVLQQQPQQQQQMPYRQDQRAPGGPPPPPPLSSIPKRRTEDQPKGSNSNGMQNIGFNQAIPKPPPAVPNPRESSPSRDGLLKEMTKVQLKKTGNFK